MRASLLAGGLIALSAAGPALACPCKRIAPAGFRMEASIIVLGEVIEVGTGAAGFDRARIRVRTARKGKLPGEIAIETASAPDPCGHAFKKGLKGEFLALREGDRFVTNACLMLGAEAP